MQRCGVYVNFGRRSADLQNVFFKWPGLKSSSVVVYSTSKRCCASSSTCQYILKRNYVTRPAVLDENIVRFVQGSDNISPKQSSQHIRIHSSSDGVTIAQDVITSLKKLKKGDTLSTEFKTSDEILNATKQLSHYSLFFQNEKEVYHVTNGSDKKTVDSEASSTVKDISDTDENTSPSDIGSIEEHLWKESHLDVQKLPQLYLQLSKIRLTGLVVMTQMAGYAIAPGAFDPSMFFFCTMGTALLSCAANSVNQFLEVPFDAQMNRTKNRVLVRKYLSELHAISFGLVSAVTGLAMLSFGVNGITAALGGFNLVLYTMAYTPMKRISAANTWVGSIVGAIPPMMGWAASSGSLEAGAWLLAAVMYAWQFPHFNALSWNLRPDYSRAGFRMLSVVDPGMCRRVAFRYCLVTTGLCFLFPVFDVTTWTFAADSLPLNVYLSYLGWRFYRDGDSNASRKLFRFSLIHVPALLILMLISKKQFGEKRTNTPKHQVVATNT